MSLCYTVMVRVGFSSVNIWLMNWKICFHHQLWRNLDFFSTNLSPATMIQVNQGNESQTLAVLIFWRRLMNKNGVSKNVHLMKTKPNPETLIHIYKLTECAALESTIFQRPLSNKVRGCEWNSFVSNYRYYFHLRQSPLHSIISVIYKTQLFESSQVHFSLFFNFFTLLDCLSQHSYQLISHLISRPFIHFNERLWAVFQRPIFFQRTASSFSLKSHFVKARSYPFQRWYQKYHFQK